MSYSFLCFDSYVRPIFTNLFLKDKGRDPVRGPVLVLSTPHFFLQNRQNTKPQMVTEPTRVTNNSSSLLDVLITSRPDQFKDVAILDITLSDHYPIYGVMNMLGTRHIKHHIITTRSGKHNISEIKKLVVKGKELDDRQDIANSLNEYFTTVASSLLVEQPPMANSLLSDSTSDAPETNFVFHLVSEEDVFKFLRTMDVTKATGADNIPTKILRIAAPCISRSITRLLNVSYLTGQFPLSWKVARVTPVSKRGSLTECDNYRPISILPNVSKVHDFFANLNLMQYAQQFDLIGKHQFAYARNSRTTVALIRAVDSWKMAIDSGEKVVRSQHSLKQNEK